MSIISFICPILAIDEFPLNEIWEDVPGHGNPIVYAMSYEFSMHVSNAQYCYDKYIFRHLNALRSSIFLLVETKYTDKLYRDSYYNYYSSKSNGYGRYCIKISFFDCSIDDKDFRDEDRMKKVASNYLGFLVLRPTPPYIIGRSVISPNALKKRGFLCYNAEFNSTALGVKFSVKGFPHSSQDSETMTCAETSLWAIMEYFGNKYSEYVPVVPSKIIKVLESISYQRQIPSKGLHEDQIAYALKKFGFGSLTYCKDEYGDEVFERILSCYIDSGVPLIAILDADGYDNGIGHTMLVVGYENISKKQYGKVEECCMKEYKKNHYDSDVVIYDYHSIKKNYVFIDDNCPAYQMASFDSPTGHYSDEVMQRYKVVYFVVPLYSKIYLDAFEAKAFVINFIIDCIAKYSIAGYEGFGLTKNDIVIRLFIASSRSYKHELAKNHEFDERIKEVVIGMVMPKFIWVAEISTRKMIKRQEAYGLILLDATEANVHDLKPLLSAFFPKGALLPGTNSGILELYSLYCKPFNIYRHNLTLYN